MDAAERGGQNALHPPTNGSRAEGGEAALTLATPDRTSSSAADRDDGRRAHARARAGDRLGDALHLVHLLHRKRHEHRRGADQVDRDDHDAGGDERPRQGAARVHDLVAEQRRGLEPAECERDRGPERDAGGVDSGHQVGGVKRRRRAEPEPRHARGDDQDADREPRAPRAEIRETAAQAGAEHIEGEHHAERDQRERQVVGGLVRAPWARGPNANSRLPAAK